MVARNCHKSVYNAIELNFLKPIYIQPKINQYGIEEQISVKEIKNKIEGNSDIKLIVITSPTYEGIISNIKEITKIAHEYSIPVLIDEAHGAHLNFDNELMKYEALNCGADIVIQSIHKTLPSLTQTAIMHINEGFVDENAIKIQLAIFETSSPSYILMSSIQECLNIIEKKGEKLFKDYSKRIENFYQQTKSLKNLKVLGNCINNEKIINGTTHNENIIYDKGKIVIITKDTNITGNELAKILREKYKIETEMSSINYLIAMTSICDTDENFIRLNTALNEIDKNIKKMESKETDYTIEIPKSVKSINEAIYSKKIQKINIKEAVEKISKEYIWIYPPGIPFITPGEVISKQIIERLTELEKAGIEIRTSFNNYPYIFVE